MCRHSCASVAWFRIDVESNVGGNQIATNGTVTVMSNSDTPLQSVNFFRFQSLPFLVKNSCA